MTLTTRSLLPAQELAVLPDDQDLVEVTVGSGEATPELIAGRDHFRVFDDDRMVLYRRGDHIDRDHARLPSKTAELVDGGFVATGRQRQPVELTERDRTAPAKPPDAEGLTSATEWERDHKQQTS